MSRTTIKSAPTTLQNIFISHIIDVLCIAVRRGANTILSETYKWDTTMLLEEL